MVVFVFGAIGLLGLLLRHALLMKKDTLFKAIEKYESEWCHVYACEDTFYKNHMLKAATILRLRLRFLEQ